VTPKTSEKDAKEMIQNYRCHVIIQSQTVTRKPLKEQKNRAGKVVFLNDSPGAMLIIKEPL
jgi:hypothetical protein